MLQTRRVRRKIVIVAASKNFSAHRTESSTAVPTGYAIATIGTKILHVAVRTSVRPKWPRCARTAAATVVVAIAHRTHRDGAIAAATTHRHHLIEGTNVGLLEERAVQRGDAVQPDKISVGKVVVSLVRNVTTTSIAKDRTASAGHLVTSSRFLYERLAGRTRNRGSSHSCQRELLEF